MSDRKIEFETDDHPIESSGVAASGWQASIARYFKLENYKTNLRTEVMAGLTTFMTMAYVLVVHPTIMSNAIFISEPGDLKGELIVVTGLSAALASSIMGLRANYPFVLAPGMGTNAFFAFSVVLGLGIPWRTALAAVFIEGLIFIALTITDLRRRLITAVPNAIKTATTVGIGMFLAYIGISGNPNVGGAGLIVADQVTKTTFGSFAVPQTLLAALGIFLAALLFVKRIKGALLWSIVGVSILGWVFSVAAAPTGFISLPAFPSTLFGQAFAGLSGINGSNIVNFISVLIVFLFVDMFDTIGTLMGVGSQAGYIDEKGELPRANQAMSADAISTAVGAILGTSTVTTFAESASGVAEGGRTGLTAVVAAIMFLVALLFVPIFEAVPAFATAPAMIIVGTLMMTSIGNIRWGDMTEAIPAYATILFIPLGYSISTGLSMGLILYPFAKLATGRGREVPMITWILAGVFIARFIFTTLAFSKGS